MIDSRIIGVGDYIEVVVNIADRELTVNLGLLSESEAERLLDELENDISDIRDFLILRQTKREVNR